MTLRFSDLRNFCLQAQVGCCAATSDNTRHLLPSAAQATPLVRQMEKAYQTPFAICCVFCVLQAPGFMLFSFAQFPTVVKKDF
jgi:hypothetical protein